MARSKWASINSISSDCRPSAVTTLPSPGPEEEYRRAETPRPSSYGSIPIVVINGFEIPFPDRDHVWTEAEKAAFTNDSPPGDRSNYSVTKARRMLGWSADSLQNRARMGRLWYYLEAFSIRQYNIARELTTTQRDTFPIDAYPLLTAWQDAFNIPVSDSGLSPLFISICYWQMKRCIASLRNMERLDRAANEEVPRPKKKKRQDLVSGEEKRQNLAIGEEKRQNLVIGEEKRQELVTREEVRRPEKRWQEPVGGEEARRPEKKWQDLVGKEEIRRPERRQDRIVDVETPRPKRWLDQVVNREEVAQPRKRRREEDEMAEEYQQRTSAKANAGPPGGEKGVGGHILTRKRARLNAQSATVDGD